MVCLEQVQLNVGRDGDTRSSKSVELDENLDIRGDRRNLALLLLLYLMQGIPGGLTSTIPMMLQKRGASYTTQAMFSFVYWPFTLKLLWAPIVDSCFSRRFGRRKSWAIPVQYLIGVFMLILSFHVDEWLGGPEKEANISVLTGIFFVLIFLLSVQGIAIDGWSLTILERRNVGYASICRSIGLTAGHFIGYGVLVSLESKDFCNTYLRSVPQETGILTLTGFIWFWAVCCLVTATLIAFFKREKEPNMDKLSDNYAEHNNISVLDTYKIILKILNNPSIRVVALTLLTVKFTWADHEGVAFFKFLDSGISKEKMIPLDAISELPVQIFVVCAVAKYAAGPNPTKIFINTIPFRTFFSLTAVAIIWLTPRLIPETGIVPLYIYFVFLGNRILYSICKCTMRMTMTSFLVRISDPAVGGTYMTLLITLNNMGGRWATSLALWMVDLLTWRDCVSNSPNSPNSIDQLDYQNNTHVSSESNALYSKCPIVIDGYYVETMICLTYGIVWYCWRVPKIRRLQKLPFETWRVTNEIEDTPVSKIARL